MNRYRLSWLQQGIPLALIAWAVASQAMAVPVPPGVYNVRDYGAVGDGKTLDSPAINAAIEKCHEEGGGTVYLTPGTYLSGSIRLKSNVELHVAKGATIKAAPLSTKAYDKPDPNPWFRPVEYADFGHCFWKNSLIWAIGQENIAVTGLGTIDGSNLSCGVVSDGEGNKTFGLKLCRNIRLKDLTIINGGWFAVLPTGCENMVIESLIIDTNRDGINLDCCRNVRVNNCTINSPGDDSIVFKSSYALGYKKPTEEVTVTNCMVSAFKKKETTSYSSMLKGEYEGIGIGRIKFGTESNGGFKNIAISNCILRNCSGITLQINDGGTMENIAISNIVMRNVVGGPICLEITNRARGPNKPAPGTMKNIQFNNIIADGSFFGSAINGHRDSPIENVTISNFRAISHGRGAKEFADKQPDDDPKSPWQGVKWKLPSYGLFCRHVRGLTLDNIRLNTEHDDMRPAFMFIDVDELELYGIKAERAPGSHPVALFQDVRNVLIDNCPSLPLIKPVLSHLTLSKSKVADGDLFSASVTAEANRNGLAILPLRAGAETIATQYAWLDRGQPADITFDNLKADQPGSHAIGIPTLTDTVQLKVEAKTDGL